MQAKDYRRIVSGLDAEGRSTVIIDGPVLALSGVQGSCVAWQTDAVPADNSGTADIEPKRFSVTEMGGGSSMFLIHTYAPNRDKEPFWHTTDTIDYITMLEGEVVFMTETGEVTLRRGDVMVDRGVKHAWRNDTDKPAVAAIVFLPAEPLDEAGGS